MKVWQRGLIVVIGKPMFFFWRIWLRAALILAMLFGCNMVAPALASPSDPVPTLHVAGCQGGGKSGTASTSACNSHCVAIPSEARHVPHPDRLRVSFGPAALPAWSGEDLPPDTPPPRSA